MASLYGSDSASDSSERPHTAIRRLRRAAVATTIKWQIFVSLKVGLGSRAKIEISIGSTWIRQYVTTNDNNLTTQPPFYAKPRQPFSVPVLSQFSRQCAVPVLAEVSWMLKTLSSKIADCLSSFRLSSSSPLTLVTSCTPTATPWSPVSSAPPPRSPAACPRPGKRSAARSSRSSRLSTTTT